MCTAHLVDTSSWLPPPFPVLVIYEDGVLEIGR